MLQNDENLADDIGNEGTEFQRAYVVGKIGAVGVSAGRQNLNLADGNIYDTRYDGVNLTFGKEVKLEAFYGKPTNSFKNWGFDKIYGARVNGKIGALNAEAAGLNLKVMLLLSPATTTASGTLAQLITSAIKHPWALCT